jgi:PIN domain nuclease of toxin-antitoxin system
MRLLLDTHAFLWFITADAQLSSAAESAIRKPGNDALLSIASVWEIAIKVNLGKLPIPLPLDTFIPEQLRLNRVTCFRSRCSMPSKFRAWHCTTAIRSTGSSLRRRRWKALSS